MSASCLSVSCHRFVQASVGGIMNSSSICDCSRFSCMKIIFQLQVFSRPSINRNNIIITIIRIFSIILHDDGVMGAVLQCAIFSPGRGI